MCASRTDGRAGGGVALLFKKEIKVTRLPSPTAAEYKHFEHLDTYISMGGRQRRFVVVYRPPPSRANGLTVSGFVEEWSEFLECCSDKGTEILMMGDLNFHLDNDRNRDAQVFRDVLDINGFVQHVKVPTHVKGHILDVVITRNGDPAICGYPEVSDPGLGNKHGHLSCDHLAVTVEIILNKPRRVRKNVSFRKWKEIDLDDFCRDVRDSLSHYQYSVTLRLP